MVAKKSKAKQKDSERMFDEIREQLEDAFLAGLGAFANAQKAGEKTFDKLVKEGEKFRKKTSKRTETLIDDVQDAIREMRDDAQSKTSDLLERVRGESRFDKFSEVFDKRVADAMDRLHIPVKKDIDAINKKLTKIMKLLEEQAEKPVAKVPAPKPKTAVVKKPAAKKPSTKKTAPKKAA